MPRPAGDGSDLPEEGVIVPEPNGEDSDLPWQGVIASPVRAQAESLNNRSVDSKIILGPGWSSAGGDMDGNHGDRPALGWNGTGSAETSAVEGDVSPAKQNTSVAPCDREGGGLATDGYGKPVGASARPDPSMREPMVKGPQLCKVQRPRV